MTTNERDAFEAALAKHVDMRRFKYCRGNEYQDGFAEGWYAARAATPAAPQEPTIDGYPLWSGIPPAPQVSDTATSSVVDLSSRCTVTGELSDNLTRCVAPSPQPEQTATQFGVDLASRSDRTAYWSPPAAIYTPGHEEKYPLAYIGAVQLARQLGYKFVATDHGMAWIKEQS